MPRAFGLGIVLSLLFQALVNIFASALVADSIQAETLPATAPDLSALDGAADRAYTVGALTRIAEPVLDALSKGELKKRLPVHGWEKTREAWTHYEAFARTLAGIAPWLSLGPDDTPEGRLRARFIDLARQSLINATDPASPDFMNFGTVRDQRVVESAYLSSALLIARRQLWEPLTLDQQAHVLDALHTSLANTLTRNNNRILFPAMIASALWELEGKGDPAPINKGVRQIEGWYAGDGVYGDGPEFRWDYTNSYVIHPMLLQVLRFANSRGLPVAQSLPLAMERAQRYAEILERLISPEGTFPVIGRSSAYRFAAFYHLAYMALNKELPGSLNPAAVRAGMTAVIRRMSEAPGTFDDQGWLSLGAVGSQPGLREDHHATGSLYLCLTGLVHLGLPADDPFWTAPAAEWTQKRIWNEEDIPRDHALQTKPAPPPIGPTKYDEDYTYLRDPANRSGAWWEPFKFIPMNSEGRSWLTIGSESRLRFEHYTNNQFGSTSTLTDSYLRFRTMPYISANLNPDVRVFVQNITAYGTLPEPFKNPFVDQTGADLLQAFVDWRIPINDEDDVIFRAGRQVLVYGSGRLINAGPNIRTAFDGGLAQWESPNWQADLFIGRPVLPEISSFDDHWDRTRRISILYATRLFEQNPEAGMDLYYIGYANDANAFSQGTGRERRKTYGTRVFASKGPWYVDTEAIYQNGNFDSSPIRAWASGTQGRYTFSRRRWAPWIGLRMDFISGDKDPRDPALQTFNAMFPQGGYFGESGVIGPANLIDLSPALGLDLGSGWSLEFTCTSFWRESLEDGLYGIAANPYRSDSGSRARYIGTQPNAVLGWQVNRNLRFYGAYEVVFPGQFIAESGPLLTVQFVAAHIVFQF